MISIGSYQLPNKVFLAPMAGVTDLPFRKLCRRLGAGMVTGEMMSSRADLRLTSKSISRGVHIDEPEPRSIQIVGWCPDMMAESAQYNVAQGASIIDINMGCPAKKVFQKAAGSALLAHPDQVERILQAVTNAVEVPVTLKIRTGVSKDEINGVEIAKIAESSGIQLIAVHGRTRSDMYFGEAEFETIKEIKENVSIPVIANGDINSCSKVRDVLHYTKCDGVMIGRGAHGAPWFPGQVAHYLQSGTEPVKMPIQEARLIVLEHLQSIHQFYGEKKGVRIARKHIKWYVESHPGSEQFRSRVNQLESAEHQLDAVFSYYSLLEKTLLAA
jgi:tRNA-dihydrouridine synthase B